MGCDIHMWAEKFQDGKWVEISQADVDPEIKEQETIYEKSSSIYFCGRNYDLFTALCGVRDYTERTPKISEPKGFPEDASAEVKENYTDWGWDAHSASWNTLAELEEFDWSPYEADCSCFLEHVIPRLRALSLDPEKVRIVYWFDN